MIREIGTTNVLNSTAKPNDSWNKRNENMEEAWDEVRESIYESFLTNLAYPTILHCTLCSANLSDRKAIKCFSCKSHLCYNCDLSNHYYQPFHNRWLVSNESWFSLKAMEFINEEGDVFTQGTNILYTLYLNTYYLIIL